MVRETIAPKNVWDSKPYNFAQGVKVRDGAEMLFIAGQSGIDKDGRIVEGFEEQVRLSFENIRNVVSAAGGTLRNVIKITTFVTNMAGLEIYSRIVGEYFGADLPAASIIQVSALALPGMEVEIEAVAIL